MSKIVIFGSSGFVGKNLSVFLLESGYEVVQLNRRKFTAINNYLNEIEGAYVFINLIGETIFQYWGKKNKQRIYDSRINSTLRIAEIISKLKDKPKLFINSSAIGIYQMDEESVESTNLKISSWPQQLVSDWENAAFTISSQNVKVTALRLGVILGVNGGFLANLHNNYRLKIAIYPSDYQNYLSYISVNDLNHIILYIIQNEFSGIINVVSNNYIRMSDLLTYVDSYEKPWLRLKIPKLLLKFFFKDGYNLIFGSYKIKSERLKDFGIQTDDYKQIIKKIYESRS